MSKQQTINFPIRRSRRVTKKIEVELPNHRLNTRSRTSSRTKQTEQILSPTKRKVEDGPISDSVFESPTKSRKGKSSTATEKIALETENESRTPTKNTPLRARRKLLSSDSPEKSLIVPDNTPIKPCNFDESENNSSQLFAEVSMKLSNPLEMTPVKSPQKHLLQNSSPVGFSPRKLNLNLHSPVKQSSLSYSLRSPLKSLNSQILKSPLKSLNSQILKSPLKFNRENLLISPRKSPRKLNQENLLLSPRKLNNENLLLSPRKSPRKLNQENLLLSPRRSPRKLPGSPLKFSTPSSMISKLTLESPSNKSFASVGLHKPNVAAYRTVKKCLNTANPSQIVGRTEQIEKLKEFLMDHFNNGKSGSLYISGPPGTGKTASLTSILNNSNFNINKVFVNCMTTRTSSDIFNLIFEGLKIKSNIKDKNVECSIERYLISSKKPVLIVLDEIDHLDCINHSTLYSIFEWPSIAKSKLVLVGIANSLDLTDRILPRLQAMPSCRPQLLHYPPYSKAELIKIINTRIEDAGLEDLQIIRPTAVQFLATKIAAVAGDVRKALDVCRRAVELCEIKARTQLKLVNSFQSPTKSPRKNQALEVVTVAQMNSIFNEVYGSKVVNAITDAPQSFSMSQKILVCTYLLMHRHGRSKDISLGKFHEIYTNICKKRNAGNVNQSDFVSMCTLMEARGMFRLKANKDVRLSKVVLSLNVDEAQQVLGDRNLLIEIMDDRAALGKFCSKK